MTPQELDKLREMQRGLILYSSALNKVEEQYQDDMEARRAVAKRGRRIQIALEDLCKILEKEQA